MKIVPTKVEIEKTVEAYTQAKSLKGKGPAYVAKSETSTSGEDAVVGFIRRNKIVGKTTAEIDALVSSAEKLAGGKLLGEGDKFKKWCEANGRSIPDEELVINLNRDPYDTGVYIKQSVGKDPLIWRSWCSYKAGKGRKRV